MTLAGRVFSNRYEIQRELAQGGMAEVYLARDQLLNRPVALKALFPEYAREPSFVERFRREAQAAANLNHPNIVAIYDWGQESGTYFIVMEYVEGRSLRDLIRSESPLDPNHAAEISAEIAAALAFAHQSGVVHRDVKPGNVLLTRAGTVKVTDFGIARAGASDGLTQTGSVMGTATYFSPEQAQGLPVDGRSDVYSLGVVLYEMVTGVSPFTGDSPVAVAYKHVREDPVPPSQRNPEIPPDLEQIIMTALAKDPEHRYQTADDMRADLLRFRRGRPLAAAPITAMVAEVPTAATAQAGQAAYAATMVNPAVDDRGRMQSGPQYPRKKKNTALIWILTIVGLAAVIGGILFGASKLANSQEQVSVPNVVGKKEADAIAILDKDNLNHDIKRVPNASKPAGIVLDQNPKAEVSVTVHSTVTLTISAGAGSKIIPATIVNQPANQVTAQLTQLGFVVKTTPQPDKTIQSGNVITSNPDPGSTADVGTTVTLIVSNGPPPIIIPPVSGQDQASATRTLNDAGFGSVTVRNEPSATVPSGNATRTDPAAGQSVPPSTAIVLYISTGPQTQTVPNEIGKTLDNAKADITAHGFVVGGILNKIDDANVGLVVAQDPAGGSTAQPGSAINLTVGVASGSGSTTTTKP